MFRIQFELVSMDKLSWNFTGLYDSEYTAHCQFNMTNIQNGESKTTSDNSIYKLIHLKQIGYFDVAYYKMLEHLSSALRELIPFEPRNSR